MRTLTIIFALVLAGAAFAEDAAPPPGGGAKSGHETYKATLEKAFADADVNKDGKLDRSEFEVAVTAVNAVRAERFRANGRPVPPAPAKEQLDEAFKKADVNNDGGLDKAEFQEAQKALRPKRDKMPAQSTDAPAPVPAPAPAP